MEEEEEEECVVCYFPTRERMRPCSHVVCSSCSCRLREKGCITCPVCRQVSVGDTSSSGGVVITFPPGTHAGVTFVASYSGVCVSKLDRRDRAHACGLRVGDVVTHLNGVRVRMHEDAAAMADRASQTQTDLVCTLTTARETVRRLLGWKGAGDSVSHHS